jgi:hypothetical protein
MKEKDCNHCWHVQEGPSMIVLRDGFILQECCKCHEHRTVHKAHAND